MLVSPPGSRGERAALVLAVTFPAPEDLDTLDEIRRAVLDSLRAAGCAIDAVETGSRGGREALHIRWTDARAREVSSQTAALQGGALVVVTTAAPTEELQDLESILEHAIDSLVLDGR